MEWINSVSIGKTMDWVQDCRSISVESQSNVPREYKDSPIPIADESFVMLDAGAKYAWFKTVNYGSRMPNLIFCSQLSVLYRNDKDINRIPHSYTNDKRCVSISHLIQVLVSLGE